MCNWDGTSNQIMFKWFGRKMEPPYEPWIVLVTGPSVPAYMYPSLVQINLPPIVEEMVGLMYEGPNPDRYNRPGPTYGG